MKSFVAWRILTHEKGRSVLAIAGIFIAIFLVFMQLGFYSSVPRGGMFMYNALRFDILLVSREYAFQIRAQTFPRRRLYQALSLPEVDSVAPMYQSLAGWLNREERLSHGIFIMAFNPNDKVLTVPDIDRQIETLRRPDTVLIDTASKAMFGPQEAGRWVEIAGRKMEIGGRYRLGLGFLGQGVVVTSDHNFKRIFPRRSLDDVSLGLVALKAGADAKTLAARLREILPRDTQVFTREELTEHEVGYWVKATSTGLVFGFGVVVAFIVGLMILFQILSTQITRNLPEYATLKAIGHTDGYLGGIVVCQALIMAIVAFLPAFGLAILSYDSTREATGLPVYMTGERLLFVLFMSLAMAIGSGLLALRIVRRADPVDLF